LDVEEHRRKANLESRSSRPSPKLVHKLMFSMPAGTPPVDGTGTAGWRYNYEGFLIPRWPDGIDQRAAIVGSVIRTVPHSGGKAKAGYVASFVAVKIDSLTP
jgi:hypothetical protein